MMMTTRIKNLNIYLTYRITFLLNKTPSYKDGSDEEHVSGRHETGSGTNEEHVPARAKTANGIRAIASEERAKV